MIKDELFERSPVRCFEKATGGLKAGELGLLSSKKGVGKTSVLVQFGVDTLLQDKQVVHVSFDQQSANVITWYQDIFTEIANTIFSLTIFIVFLDNFIKFTIFKHFYFKFIWRIYSC